jgi:hypothetical protein
LILTLVKKKDSIEGPGPLVALINEHKSILTALGAHNLKKRLKELSKLVKSNR